MECRPSSSVSPPEPASCFEARSPSDQSTADASNPFGPMRVLQGQVLLFTISGCPYCRRAKNFLAQLRLPYVEVNLDAHPGRRSEAYALSGRRTVPQIFFNERHVGGCDDLFALPEDELEQLIAMVESVPAPPGAPQLLSASSPAAPTAASSSSSQEALEVFSCETDVYMALIEAMMHPVTGVPTKDRMWHMRRYPACFIGRDAVTWLINNGYAPTREAAVALGNELVDRHFFHHVTHDHCFKDEKLFFRFLRHCKTKALNGDPGAHCEPEDPAKLGETIRRAILQLYDQYLSPDGRHVDYAGIGASAQFEQFRCLTVQLQRANVATMTRAEKLAFFINIYNALVVHAMVVKGQPKTGLQRAKFFGSMCYLIGGHEFSLNDIEHGILRGNRRVPFGFFKPFSSKDPRFPLRLLAPEPRIHFALVCGAKSCPAIKTYSAAHVDDQLTAAAQAFFESPTNLEVNVAKKSVVLSKILDWYAVDFGRNSTDVLAWIVSFAPPGVKDQLQQLLDQKSSLTIEYRPYDWSVNGST